MPLILIVTEMMILTVSMTMKMTSMKLDGPICENILQSLDMTTPKLKFGKNPEQLLLQNIMESGPREAPI